MVYSLGAPYRHLMLKEMESAQSRTTARGKCIEARDEKGTRRSHSWPRPRAARLPCASGCLPRALYNARCGPADAIGPLRFCGIDMSRFSVAKTAVFAEILKRKSVNAYASRSFCVAIAFDGN